jgi:hypothetical protein
MSKSLTHEQFMTNNKYLLLNHMKNCGKDLTSLGLSEDTLQSVFRSTNEKGLWVYARSLTQPNHSTLLFNRSESCGEFAIEVGYYATLTKEGLEAVENYTPEDR